MKRQIVTTMYNNESKCTPNQWIVFFTRSGKVVQKLDSAIHRVNLYPVDNAIGFPNTYPLDSDLSGG